ncbi:FkbM family methyltransferase, partial [Acinetobacter baumannii]
LPEVGSGQVNIGCSSLLAWTSRNHRAGSSVKGIEDRENVQRAYPVPVFRADDLTLLGDRQILLVAVDIEGAELAFLRGAETLLRR